MYRNIHKSNKIPPPDILSTPHHASKSIQDDCVEFLSRIDKSPRRGTLLLTLQKLLQTDPDKDEALIWKNIQNILLQDYSESKDVLVSFLSNESSIETKSLQDTPVPPQPPPPPPLECFSPPPPPPPMSSWSQGTQMSTTLNRPAMDASLPQQSPPVPTAKMKIICWDKISSHQIIGGSNLWTTLAKNHKKDSLKHIDWLEAEKLFSLQLSPASNAASTMSRVSKMVKLLDSQRTFNIDILLEQFKGYKSDTDIVQLVYRGDHSVMGSEKIRRLIKLLPEPEEIEVLKHFNGNHDNLARAEKFLLLLIDVPSYKLRLECMSLKEDFTENAQVLQSSMECLIEAGKDLINNQKLHEVLYTIVLVGNFLNSGKYTGNAGGIRIASLPKLTNIRANAKNMNFMHFIVGQIKKSQPELLGFPLGLQNLSKVNKINIEQIFVDVKRLNMRLQQVRAELESPNTGFEIIEEMMPFLLKVEARIDNLKSGMTNVESMHSELSKFFCDDSSNFSLSECYNVFQIFTENFTKAVNDLNEFEVKSTQRMKQKLQYSEAKIALHVKSKFDSIPEATHEKKHIAKPTNCIQHEIVHLNNEHKEINDIKKFWMNSQERKSLSAKTLENRSKTHETIGDQNASNQESSKQQQNIHSGKIQKLITNIESTNNPTNDKALQRPSQESPAPRTSSFRLKYPEKPTLPKFEKIGKRVSSITEQDLREIIQKLRRTPSTDPNVWDIPREKLLEHIECYHAEENLSLKETPTNKNSTSTSSNNIAASNNLDTSKSINAFTNETPSQKYTSPDYSLQNPVKSSSIYKRFKNKFRIFNKTKGL